MRSIFLSAALLIAFGLLTVWTSTALSTHGQSLHSSASFAFVASPVPDVVADAEAEAAAAPPPALIVAMQTAIIKAPIAVARLDAESVMKVSPPAPVEATLTEDALCQTHMVHLTATLWVTTALAAVACPPSQTVAAHSPAAAPSSPSPTNPLTAIVSPLSVIALSPLTLPTMPVPTVEPPVHAQGLPVARAQAATDPLQVLFAARANGITTSLNFIRNSSRELVGFFTPAGTITLRGTALTGSHVPVDSMLLYFNALHFSRFGERGGELAVGNWDISVRVPTVQNTMWTLMYQAPQPLYLDEAGGYTVAQQAGVTVDYVHRVFRNEGPFRFSYTNIVTVHVPGKIRVLSYTGVSILAGTMFTHYLAGEHAAFALQYRRYERNEARLAQPSTVFHGGGLAPASYFAQSLEPAVYAIPAGAAFGHMKNGQLYGHMYNHAAGALAVDFASQLASINLTLSVALNSRDSRYNSFLFAYELRDFQLSLSADKRTFSNLHCPSAGGTATAGCGGEVFSNGIYDVNVGGYQAAVKNSVSASSNSALKVHGAFYGDRAQEFALALDHLISDDDGVFEGANNGIFIGALGRKQQGSGGGAGGASGASGSSAPAGAIAAFADGTTVWLTADYRAFARAEYAAFAAMAISGVQQMAHIGTRTPASFFPSLTHQAVYRIDAGQAGGWHTGAGGARLSLGNIGSADQLRVDFATDTAALDLSFQDASGVHGYVLQGVDLRLQAEGNGFQFCGVCTGTVTGSGALSGFDSVQGLQVDGAFYGDSAQEAAGVLRHRIGSSGESLDLGFVGAAATDKR